MYKNSVKGSVAFAVTATSGSLTGHANELYLVAKGNACLFELGATATSASTYLPGSSPICIPCDGPATIGVIQDTASGTLFYIEFF